MVNGPIVTDNNELWVYNIDTELWEAGPRNNGLEMTEVSGEGHGFGISQLNINDLIHSSLTEKVIYSDGGYIGQPKSADVHDDIEDIVYHPTNPDEVWLATHGGLSKSIDNGETWTPKSDQIGVAMVSGISTSAKDPSKIALGLNHYGAIVTDPNVAWYYLWRGDGAKPLIPDDGETVWGSTTAGTRLEFNYDGVYTQIRNVSSYSEFGDPIFEENKGNFSHIYMNRKNSSSYNTESTDVWRTVDGGSLEMISDFTQKNWYDVVHEPKYAVTGIYTTQADPNYIYAYLHGRTKQTGSWCCDTYKVFRTTKGMDPSETVIQNSWVEIPLTPPIGNSTIPGPIKDDFVQDIEVSHTDPNVIFIAQRSSNRFQPQSDAEEMVYRVNTFDIQNPTYRNITYNLPKSEIGAECMALERGTNEGLYIATNKGVFFTNKTRLDNTGIPDGQKWILVGSGIPHVEANGIEINYAINKIRIGTNGRGVWEHELECPAEYNLSLYSIGSATEYWEVENNLESTREYPSSFDINYRAGNKITLNPGFHYSTTNEAKFHAFIHGCDEPGNSFKARSNSSNLIDTDIALEEIESSKITIYPNPSNGQFNIDIEDLEEEEALIEIYDLAGRKVFSKTSNVDLTINISDQSKGVYLVKINIGNNVFTEKVIYQ